MTLPRRALGTLAMSSTVATGLALVALLTLRAPLDDAASNERPAALEFVTGIGEAA